jgi:hypothetical protein
MKEITRNDIEVAVENYLLKGGKIKKLSPQRSKNFFWGISLKEFKNPHERADRVLERVLDSIEVDFFELMEREDIEFAEYYEESAK